MRLELAIGWIMEIVFDAQSELFKEKNILEVLWRKLFLNLFKPLFRKVIFASYFNEDSAAS